MTNLIHPCQKRALIPLKFEVVFNYDTFFKLAQSYPHSVRKVVSRSKFTEQMYKLFDRTEFPNVRANCFLFSILRMAEEIIICLSFFNTGFTEFYDVKVRAGRKLRLSVQTAVQILFRQTKNTDSLRSKISQNKSSKFKKWRNGPVFWPCASMAQS